MKHNNVLIFCEMNIELGQISNVNSSNNGLFGVLREYRAISTMRDDSRFTVTRGMLILIWFGFCGHFKYFFVFIIKAKCRVQIMNSTTIIKR